MQTTTARRAAAPPNNFTESTISLREFEVKSPINQQEQWAYPRSIQANTNTNMFRESLEKVN